ncbi:hypothetical protein [Anditalea andensis]|uniref:hypothetical protein n=1 Tax=Anditalea andensis TaxID=1048983 RepID=UPI0013E05168|nr:hypothetical protein [Anditalea andensis]
MARVRKSEMDWGRSRGRRLLGEGQGKGSMGDGKSFTLISLRLNLSKVIISLWEF